jgi:hypothetical protein
MLMEGLRCLAECKIVMSYEWKMEKDGDVCQIGMSPIVLNG